MGKVTNFQRFIFLEEMNLRRELGNTMFILTRNPCFSSLEMNLNIDRTSAMYSTVIAMLLVGLVIIKIA